MLVHHDCRWLDDNLSLFGSSQLFLADLTDSCGSSQSQTFSSLFADTNTSSFELHVDYLTHNPRGATWRQVVDPHFLRPFVAFKSFKIQTSKFLLKELRENSGMAFWVGKWAGSGELYLWLRPQDLEVISMQWPAIRYGLLSYCRLLARSTIPSKPLFSLFFRREIWTASVRRLLLVGDDRSQCQWLDLLSQRDFIFVIQ